MRHSPGGTPLRQPLLIEQARRLNTFLKTLSAGQLAKIMGISPALAQKTYTLTQAWSDVPEDQSMALDSFTGDIYSGLHANDLLPADREYADQVLRILSGLYGIVSPFDGIHPYRLEMGYSLPDPEYNSLYAYWGDSIAGCLPEDVPVVNLAAAEYTRTVTRYVDANRITTPKFLTVSPKTGQPEFVVVHAKIARGAFARWLITRRVQNLQDLVQFEELGYRFDRNLSSPGSPAFVCETFGGKGLSIRLS